MLAILAFLNSSDIFLELFGPEYDTASGILASVVFVQTSALTLQEVIDDSFETLELYSFLQWNKQTKTFAMHKLAHEWSLERLGIAEQVKFCFAAWSYLSFLNPVAESIPAMVGRLVSHTTSCFIRVRSLCHVDNLAIGLFVDLADRLVELLSVQGQYDRAYDVQTFTHEYHERRRSIDPATYARSLYHISGILVAQYKYDAAEVLLQQALEELKEPLSTEGCRIREGCQLALALLLARYHKRVDEAEHMLRIILLGFDCTKGWWGTQVESTLAEILVIQHKYSEAEAIYRQILTTDEHIPEFDRLFINRGLTQELRRQGKLVEAEIVAREASDATLVHGPADHRSQLALLNLGKVKLDQKAYGEAASILGKACDAIAIPYHAIHLDCLEFLAHALHYLECHDEGLSCRTRAIDGFARMY